MFAVQTGETVTVTTPGLLCFFLLVDGFTQLKNILWQVDLHLILQKYAAIFLKLESLVPLIAFNSVAYN